MSANPNITNKNSLDIYKACGVDICGSKSFHNKIKTLAHNTHQEGLLTEIGGFASAFDITNLAYKHPIITSCCDGVGSKLQLANYVNYYNNIGIDLVAMCVNDLLTTGSKPLSFLNYLALGELNEERDIAILESIIVGCQIANCTLAGGETAQMPIIYKANNYDLAGFALGIVERSDLLPKKHNIKAGDVLIGLASNGVHANGFSLIHKLLLEESMKFAELLLSPTKIYVKPVLKTLEKFDSIKAISHITGGGFIDNLPRILPQNLAIELDVSKFPHNSIFTWLAQKLNFDTTAMLQIFNCGIGLALIVDVNYTQSICKYLNEQNEAPIIIGKVIEKTNNKITLKGKLKGIK